MLASIKNLCSLLHLFWGHKIQSKRDYFKTRRFRALRPLPSSSSGEVRGGLCPPDPSRGVWRQEGFAPPLTYALYKPILHYTLHSTVLLPPPPHTSLPPTRHLTPCRVKKKKKYPHLFKTPLYLPCRHPPYPLHRVLKKKIYPHFFIGAPPIHPPCCRLPYPLHRVFVYPHFFYRANLPKIGVLPAHYRDSSPVFAGFDILDQKQ